MEICGQPEQPSLQQTILMSRGFLIFMIVVAGWSLYSMLRHESARFSVPHDFLTSFAVFGRAGGIIDLCMYLWMIWIWVIFFRLARNWTEQAWVASGIGPILINPLKMLIPRFSYVVWWLELCLTLAFFLATVALFLNWRPAQTLARCRARFNTTTELPPAPKP